MNVETGRCAVVGIESALCGFFGVYISADLELEELIKGAGCSALLELLSLVGEAIVLEPQRRELDLEFC